MPKTTPYHLIWNPQVGAYALHDLRNQQVISMTPDSEAWLGWVARFPSFTFDGRQGHLTVRQESRSGSSYWYAYRSSGGKTSKKYLGKTNELTLTRLETIAGQLATSTTLKPVLVASPPKPEQEKAPILYTQHLPSSAAAARRAPSALSGGWYDFRLATAFAAPRLRLQLVRRARLLNALTQSLEATLTLLSAPAGFGKTTLLAQWLNEIQMPFIWVSLEPRDNEPIRFLSTLIAALQSFDLRLGANALGVLKSPHSSPLQSETIMALLVADLYQQPLRDVVLVLDDYHLIEDKVLHQALASFIEHAPPQLHLVIATRTDPALPLARLRARGQLCEVQANHLQFQPEETNSFLEIVMGLDLSLEEKTLLQRRTEGWVAGLQLAALSLRDHSDVQLFLANLTGSHRHIVDYLVEEVLNHQPETIQSFLLQTSILERLSGPLCDAVIGRSKSDSLLEHLDHANLFLIPLDEHRRWYRYHHLFAEVLRTRLLQTLGPEEITDLYTRASIWYEGNGMPAEAVEAALSARDFSRATRLIDETLALPMLMDQQDSTLIRWLERFPQEILFSQGFLCLIYAWSLFCAETPAIYERPLEVAEQLFQVEGNRKGLGQIWTLRAIAASGAGDAAQTITYANQALQVLPKEAFLERSIIASAQAEGYRLIGEVEAAWEVLAEARPLRELSSNTHSMLGDTIALGNLLVMQGKLHDAARLYTSVLDATNDRLSLAAHALIGLGEIARERNDPEEATVFLEQALSLARRTRETLLQARASILLARTFQGWGEAERAEETWSSAISLAQQGLSSNILEQARAYQVRNWLRQGKMDDVLHWQRTAAFTPEMPFNYQQEVQALTFVRTLIAQGDAAEALHLLERWHTHARTQKRTGSEIEMLILAALARQMQSKSDQAIQQLQQALLLAVPEGYVRLFVDEGEPMLTLLSQVIVRLKGKKEAEAVHKLLALLQAEQATQGKPSLVPSSRRPSIEPLSARERKVLHGLAAGLSNAEIAAELVVSINTIRTQAQSIYRKLNVTTRQEAVAQAHYWKLL